MKIKCKNGLCDKLAMIFSYLYKARIEKQLLEVLWEIDQECNGHFLELFKPIKDLEFIENIKCTENIIIDWKPHIEFDPSKKFIYEELKLKENIKIKIENLKSKMNNYSALHVRKTDKLCKIKAPYFTLMPDDVYFDFINKQPKSYNIFLATDCVDTQNKFKLKYGNKIKCSSEMKFSEELRQTTLEIAVIDLFTCIDAKNFFGTQGSGFSRFIEQHRLHKKIQKIKNI